MADLGPDPDPEHRIRERAATVSDLEMRIQALITRLENWNETTSSHPDPVADHWFTRGMDEAYDNVLDQLYWILGVER
jgi:hypothetical protein